MLPLLLLLLPSAVLASYVPPAAILAGRADGAVSPNKTCGASGAGLNNNFTCPDTDGCCSQYGFCGNGDAFCLTSAGCQATYSHNKSSCYDPKSGSTVSIDGTCGTTGAGKVGYRCPGQQCCSSSGYCGNTTNHCDVGEGCQSQFGHCNGTTSARSLPVSIKEE